MTRYAVLPGYGHYNKSKRDYKKYLDRFVSFVEKKKIDVVVVCGGPTDPNMPKKTEAATMAEYLQPLLDKRIKIHVEGKSMTSGENIRFSRKFVNLGKGDKVFIITDSVRFFRTFWFMLYYWFGLSKRDIAGLWYGIASGIYQNPKKPDRALRLKEIRSKLKYRNVTIVIDRIHRSYKEAVHCLISNPLEIEALYDKDVRRFASKTLKLKYSVSRI